MKPSALELPPKFTSFRSHPGFDQWEVCKRIATSFTTHRHVLLHAPPGVGKTLIAATVQKLIPSAVRTRPARMLFLTPSRGLQDQLDGEFPTVKVVKGRSNYYCPEFKGGCDLPAAAESVCSIERPGNNILPRCGYRVAIREGYDSPTPCANYAFWFSLARYGDPDALGYFDLLVCDEAHSILDTLTEFASIVLRPDDTKLIGAQLPRFERIDQWSLWAEDKLPAAREAMSRLSDRTPPKERIRVLNLSKSLNTLANIDHTSKSGSDIWVPDCRSLDVKISPLWPDKLTESLLFRSIPRVLLCSGSLTPDIIPDLGIDPSTAEFIEVASTSPPVNRPVIYLNSQPEIKVEHSMSQGERRAIVRKVDSIIDVWGGYKGIILSTSYDWAGEIQRTSRYGYESQSDMIVTHDRGRVAEAITRYRSQDRGVLVSPALWEGYDFPECSWLIFLKIPFMDSRDPLLSARKKARKGFANSLIAARVLQGSMRHIRSHTDKGAVFILDWHWTHFSHNAFFPQYYKSAWRVRDTIPTPKELGFK